MSLTLDSLAVDDQVATPTPGSPHPYIPVDNHDRLNSIQLSSDASGEFSVTHSPRSFLDAPGEALSELRNARNPPWLHGLTGTPPSILGLHSTDRAGRWVEDARRHTEQQPIDLATHTNLARLSLNHGLIAPRDMNHLPPQLPQTALMGQANLIARISLDKVSKVVAKPKASPFDKPTSSHKDKRIDGSDRRAIGYLARQPSPMFKSNEGQSGDVSSEEEEAWPMPETPFMSHDVWSDPNHKGLAKSTKFNIGPQPTALGHSAIPPELHKVVSAHRKQANAGARGNNATAKGTAKEGERRVGRCKMYNCDKGVGFLIDDRLDQVPHDVKIHWTDIYSDQEFKSLAKGEVVEYTLNITANGFSASYVTGPGGRPVMGAEQAIVQASRQTSYKLFKAGALPVKTYRSKWETILSPVASDSSHSQPAATIPANTRPTINTRSIPKITQSKGEPNSAPPSAGVRNPNPAGKVASYSNEQPKGVPTDIRKMGNNESGALLNPEHLAFNHSARIPAALNPPNQFHTPGWSSLRSQLNYLQSPNSLVTSFSGSHTPLPALSHSLMTPLSAEACNPMFPGGYTPHHTQSVRSPTVAIATPSEVSNPFLVNRLLNPSQHGMNQTDLQSFLAERQLLLQQQALLMSMYQSNSQPAPATTIQPLQQLPVPNPLSKSHTTKTGDVPQFYGAYERAGLTLDPKLPYFGLLPPIALPVNKEAPKLSDLLPKRNTGTWRTPELTELKVDSPAGLRANAEAFKPSGSNSPRFNGIESKTNPNTDQNPSDVSKTIDGRVYQIPGRRSVSDPASNGTAGNKNFNVLVHLQSNGAQLEGSGCAHVDLQLKPGVDKSGNPKRVTFAEQLTPARRVVSHGEVVGTTINRSVCVEEVSSEAGEESIDITSFESGCISSQKVDQYSHHLEEIRNRVVGDVKSVDLAMERLREAARPRRFSFIKDTNTGGFKDLAACGTVGNGATSSSGLTGPKISPDANHHCDGLVLDNHEPKLSLMIQEAVTQIPNNHLKV